jgi:hypothetical protein
VRNTHTLAAEEEEETNGDSVCGGEVVGAQGEAAQAGHGSLGHDVPVLPCRQEVHLFVACR